MTSQGDQLPFPSTGGFQVIHLVIAGIADSRKYKMSFIVGLEGHNRSL